MIIFLPIPFGFLIKPLKQVSIVYNMICIISLTLVCNILNVFALRPCHIAQVGEDDKTREQAGETVYCGCYQTVSENIQGSDFCINNRKILIW